LLLVVLTLVGLPGFQVWPQIQRIELGTKKSNRVAAKIIV